MLKSTRELSELTGRAWPTVSRAVQNLPVTKRGNANCYESRDALPLIYGIGAAANQAPDAPAREHDLEAERARLAHHQANKAALEEAETRGELLRADDVSAAVDDAFARVRARLLSLPTKLSPIVVGSTDPIEVQAAIENGVREALAELSAEATNDDDGDPVGD